MIITFLLLDFMVMQSDFPQTGTKVYALYPRRMNDIKGLVQDLHLNMDLTEQHKIKLMAPWKPLTQRLRSFSFSLKINFIADLQFKKANNKL